MLLILIFSSCVCKIFVGFNKMKLIAITGSIGCGKTTIAKVINQLGYTVFDVDAWVRALYFQKDFINKIVETFPQTWENGTFNKRTLRHIVFDDNQQLKILESLIHPFLKEKLKTIIRKNAHINDLFFLDVALLFEMGWDKYCDLVIVADVDDLIQKQRVMIRDGVSAEHFDKINNVQMSQADKKKRADVIIETDVSLNLLKIELLSVLEGMS